MENNNTKKNDKEIVTRAFACRKIAESSNPAEILPYLEHENKHPRKSALYKLTNKLGVSLSDVVLFLQKSTERAGKADNGKVSAVLVSCGVPAEKVAELLG